MGGTSCGSLLDLTPLTLISVNLYFPIVRGAVAIFATGFSSARTNRSSTALDNPCANVLRQSPKMKVCTFPPAMFRGTCGSVERVQDFESRCR